MKKAIQFLIPVAALLAMVAFAACDSGDDAPTNLCVDVECADDETCNPTTGECIAIIGDLCADIVCDVEGETCDPTDGVCKADVDPCEDVECGDCEECNAGTCETTCVDDEECIEGACVAPVVCDPACGPCETCNEEDMCDSDCGDDDVCFNEECCTPMCDDLECGGDGCGGDCGTCDADTEFCNDGTCELKPTVTCQDDMAVYCDATIVNELVIATAPDANTGDPGCCCDYNEDGTIDNAVAGLIANVGSMADLSLEDLNLMVAEELGKGTIIVLFEMIGLTNMDATDYFDMNFFLGADADDDATNNFDGDAEFMVMAESLDENLDPLIKFEGASLDEDGVLNAPGADGDFGQFIIPIDVPDYGVSLQLTIDGVRLQAELAQTDDMYEMANGTLCGYVTAAQIFGALNSFIEGNCDCLNIDGDAIIDNGDGTYTCGTPTATPTCDPDDPDTGEMQEICNYVTQYCTTSLTLIPMFLDVDVDGDGDGDGISLGATFGATSAVIVEDTVE